MFQQEMTNSDVAALAMAARDIMGKPEQSTAISAAHPKPEILRSEAGLEPDLDLFHFSFSLCSQKVRAVLAELKLTYGSNQFEMSAFENYAPEYVRLRMQSDAAKTSELVSSWSGATSVDQNGFDPLVVPTLVDNGAGRVVADSKLICLYLARRYRDEIDLVPADIESAIVAQMDLVDQTPHAALLYGANPDGDTRPPPFQQMMPGIHKHKIDAIRSRMALIADDPELVSAYEHKIRKEKAGAEFVMDENAMRCAMALTGDLVASLEKQLSDSGGPWIFGQRLNLADLMWAVSLIRLNFLGYGSLWTGQNERPHVKDYLAQVRQRPSIKTAVLDWP